MSERGHRSRRLKLRLEFDGALFCGWQLQSEEHESRKTSVQGEIERALGVLLRSRERIVVQGCGRTDAGVSARDFYVHVDVPEQATCPDGQEALEKFRHSLNGILPEGVAVLAAERVASDFNALHSVCWKTYQYKLLVRRAKPTIERDTHYWIPESLKNFRLDAIRATLELFVGRHDFVAFAASDHTAQTTEREIFKAELSVDGDVVSFSFTGEGFLKYMVRTLSGTLVEVGQGKRDVASVKRLLSGHVSRTESGHCAPAHALCLLKVCYDENQRP